MRSPEADGGFTLVELMVVVLVIGVLVAVAIPVFLNARAQAERSTCFANQRIIENAVTMWVAAGHDMSTLGEFASYSRSGSTVPGYMHLIDDGYLKSWPTCPSNTDSGEDYYIEYGHSKGLRWRAYPYYRGCDRHGYYATNGGFSDELTYDQGP